MEDRATAVGPGQARGRPRQGDQVVDDVYDALGAFYRFFFDVFGRDSFDGRGAALESVVHYGRAYNNAFWDGRRLMVGDGSLFVTFATIDIVSHGVPHGILATETSLPFKDQPGALMVSVADVFGSMVLQHHNGQRADQASWIVGEGVFHPQQHARGLRSLAHRGSAYDSPTLGKDPQVGRLDQYVKTKADNGGIHLNSGIPNRAFHLAAVGLGGHSLERAGRVWYEVVVSGKLTAITTFRRFAQLTVRAAADRYGPRSEEVIAIADAWNQVGVLTRRKVASPAR